MQQLAETTVAGQDTLLDIQNLTLSLRDQSGWVEVLNNVSLSVKPKEILGVVGESGCGKSMTALSILRLLPPRDSRLGGNIMFGGQNLAACSESQMNRIRGRHISMIFQEPMSALDPVFTVGYQIEETLRRHFKIDRREAAERAVAALDSVGIASPRHVATLYPMNLSGGMRQRVMIALAMACNPTLLIADEPTTALDVTIQAQIVQLLVDLVRDRGVALVLITHDMGVVAQACDRVVVLYAGRVAESNSVSAIFASPRHPYTKALIQCIPRDGMAPGSLAGIPGSVPSVSKYPAGCRFNPRCPEVQLRCPEIVPSLEQHPLGGTVACHAVAKVAHG